MLNWKENDDTGIITMIGVGCWKGYSISLTHEQDFRLDPTNRRLRIRKMSKTSILFQCDRREY